MIKIALIVAVTSSVNLSQIPDISIANLYDERLKDNDNLLLPPSPNSDPKYFDVYQNYEIEANNRDNLKKYLAEKGIGTLIQWNGQPVHSLTKLGFSGKGLPNTEDMYKKCLMIPMNTSLSNNDIDYVAESINKFYKI